jgi:hypothetical protein
MKAFKVISKKKQFHVQASSIASAAAIVLGCDKPNRQMGTAFRSYSDAKGKAAAKSVYVFTQDEIVPDFLLN